MTSQIDELNLNAWELRRTDVNETYRLAEEALRLSQENGYKKGIAESLRSLGFCYWQFSDYPSALEKSQDALTLFRELKDKKGQADTVSSLGAVYAFMGDNENRLRYNLDCLQLRKDINDKEGELTTLNNIGDTYMTLGQTEKALECFFTCLESPHVTAHNKAIVLLNIGEAYFILRDYKKSAKYLSASIAISSENGFERFLIAGLMLLGKVHVAENDIPSALLYLNKALDKANAISNNEYLYELHLAISDALEKGNDVTSAFEHFKKFHSIKEKVLNEDVTGKIRNIQLHHKVQSAQKETELERIKNEELKKTYTEIETQRNQILEKNKQITDSIRYAKRIQEAILPGVHEWHQCLPDSFVLYLPKDIVSGDFYWIEKRNGKIVVAAVDCTGHGVPGAFMSIIGNNLLNQIVREHGITKPAEILDHLRIGISKMLNQESGEFHVHDGMDISICRFDPASMILEYAGAYNPLYLIRDGDLKEVKADKISIGVVGDKHFQPFSNHELKLYKGDQVYLFSDGYADQFGGPRGKKFKYIQLKNLLRSVTQLTMKEQGEKLKETIETWKGNLEQVDDIMVIGFKV